MLMSASFFREVLEELRKVVWPTRNEVIRLTSVVIIVSLLVGLFLGGVDFVLTKLLSFLIK
ncbi:MAG TPA: preprotein translocase subunit SecE [Patescibacteria group bacterium]|nr:preprotein translocase subunit SecE [Patescibacteria group bacterium]